MNRIFHWALPVIVVLLCAMKGEVVWNKYVIHGYAQGTTYTVTYFARDSLLSRNDTDRLLATIDSSMSLYKPYSLINKINSGGEGNFSVDSHFNRVVRKSFEIYHRSEGIFDITVAPLVELWGFGINGVDHLPDSAEVDSVLACVGMDRIEIAGVQFRKMQSCTRVDLNGIAQGYSVDVLAELLERKGIGHYLVELGGELRVSGPKPDGTPIRIGIERPVADGSAYPLMDDVIELQTGAVTTAGNYRKFVMDGNRRISHHINPTTGYPFQTGVISATVFAPDAMTADGYDNVFMAMSMPDAIAFADRMAELEVYLIYQDSGGTVRDTMSRGFRGLISKQQVTR